MLATLGVDRPCCVTEELPAAAWRFENGRIRIHLPKAGRVARRDGAFQLVDAGRDINLIVVHSRDGRFAALARSCTHGGAQVVFNPDNQTVQCTSWGHSEFSLDGLVLGGSAKRQLPVYEVQRRGDWLEITL